MNRCGAYIDTMRNAFGTRFLVFLFLVQCLLKGVVFVIMTSGMLPLFKRMGINAAELQMYAAIAMSPWTLKPAIGLLSDLFPLGGYHKRYYLVFAMLIGLLGVSCLVADLRVPALVVFFVFFVHVCISVCDLLTEAAYAKKMREHPETGSSIVTLVQGFQQVGFLIALSFMGVLSDHNLFTVAYAIALGCIVSPLWPILQGWLPERTRHLWEKGLHRVCGNRSGVWLYDRARIRSEWRILLLVAGTGLAGPVLGVVTAFANEIVGLVLAILVLVGVTVAGYRSFPRTIANVALYQILTQVSRISVGSALDYFFTANPQCLPGGPNFDYTFYVTYTGLLGAAISLGTVFLYQAVFNKWRFRTVLVFTSVLSGCGGIFDFIMTMRWNVHWGIPDKYFYILGDGIIHDMVDMLYWIPSSSIIAKVCPVGIEAGIFSYLAGVSNYGRMVSTLLGAQLIRWSGMQTTPSPETGECYWGPLPWLVLGGHILLMLVVSIPAAWLVPNLLQTEDVQDIDTYTPPEEQDELGDAELDDMARAYLIRPPAELDEEDFE